MIKIVIILEVVKHLILENIPLGITNMKIRLCLYGDLDQYTTFSWPHDIIVIIII